MPRIGPDGIACGNHLVNMARGDVVDEAQVALALQSGALATYSTDVFVEEPPDVDCELLRYAQEDFQTPHMRLFVTPHIGAATLEAKRRVGQQIVAAVLETLETGNPPADHLVNKDWTPPPELPDASASSVVDDTSVLTTNAVDQREAQAMRTAGATNAIEHLGNLKGSAKDLTSVEIDEGTFKYVLVSVLDPDAPGGLRYLVRGDRKAGYHRDAAQPLVQKLREKGLKYNVVGGGRIYHCPQSKTIHIYGFSYGFPWEDECQHHITAELCRKAFPDYLEITWADEGY
ncbi:hypothetical protein CYMTET_32364 [Cymbomonas tetramitiformis]|uniref:D-isomer specific 2-hydroxyacid dehydrogenase NAD-binding domain-containing protein n=1 Tax=Cymbomonas tetramitiformis TaxID=36881 RepID=A0AAE0FFT4_9CHLO|nr:hypothetical protein CYMTET_32364 [Cymbomonas tetramitiformis]